ncbi:MAG: heavy metal-binding domain-containing protein [Chitinophagales bacterium]
MKKTTFKLTMIALAVVGIMLVSCGNNTGNDASNTEQTESVEETYACPMHPEVKGQKGDTCSKCGMDLEAVAEK